MEEVGRYYLPFIPRGSQGLTAPKVTWLPTTLGWEFYLVSLHPGASYMHEVAGKEDLAGLSDWEEAAFLFLLQARP